MLTEAQALDFAIKTVSLVGPSITKFIKDCVKDFTTKLSIDMNAAFDFYLKNALKKYSKTKTLLYREVPKFLYDFYECIDVSYDGNAVSTINVSNLTDITHYLLITGTGGIGKSTLMKHLFINAICLQQFIPVYIELRGINNDTSSLSEYIYKCMYSLGFNLDKKYFDYAMQSGRFLILLDGYDEVLTEKRQSTFKDINLLCDMYGSNYYIITSRNSEEFISWQRFTEVKCMDLTLKQAVSLIEKIDYDFEVKNKFILSLKNELYSTHRAFATNPLLLNIMLLTYSNFADIPAKIHLFYEYAFEALMSKHDATKEGMFRRPLKCCLSSDMFKKVLSSFSLSLYHSQNIEFTIDEMQDAFAKGIAFSANIGMDINCISSLQFNDFYDDVTNSLCLIYKDGLNYHFIHRSFQEYFVALYISSCTDNLQKKILIGLYQKKPHSLDSDAIYKMLFDMQKIRFEKNFILPLLDEYFPEQNEFLDDFTQVKLLVESVHLEYYINEERVFTSYVVKNSSILYLLIFTRSLYGHYDLVLGAYVQNRLIEQLERSKKSKFITLKDLAPKSKLYRDALAMCANIPNSIRQIYGIKREIQARHQQMPDDLDALFM